jgi:hypothetical protein
MPKVKVATGTPQDGEYDLDLSHFTTRERAYIAKVSGTRPPEFFEAWFGGDPMTVVATIGVMMQRAGKHPDLDALLDADEKALTIDYSDLVKDGDDVDPPAQSPSESDELGEKSEDAETSG